MLLGLVCEVSGQALVEANSVHVQRQYGPEAGPMTPQHEASASHMAYALAGIRWQASEPKSYEYESA